LTLLDLLQRQAIVTTGKDEDQFCIVCLDRAECKEVLMPQELAAAYRTAAARATKLLGRLDDADCQLSADEREYCRENLINIIILSHGYQSFCICSRCLRGSVAKELAGRFILQCTNALRVEEIIPVIKWIGLELEELHAQEEG